MSVAVLGYYVFVADVCDSSEVVGLVCVVDTGAACAD